jgi:hypothetical protein
MVSVHEKLYVCGGWNSMKQFDDLYVFDLPGRVWVKIEGGSGDKWGESP